MPQITELEIRPYTVAHAAAFHAAVIESVRELQPWMPWCHPQYSHAEATDWVTLQAQSFANGSEFEFLILDKTDTVIGACGINQIDQRNRRANVGYWVRSAAVGRQNATTAVKLLVGWAARNTDLQRLEVVIAIENAASIRVAQKAGAFHEGVLKSRLLLHGRFHDAVISSFVRGENMAHSQ